MALIGERAADERNGNDKALDRAQAERTKAVAAAIATIEKQFGTGSIMKLGSGSIQAIDVIPTGSIALDLALGVGGIPRGRITEIFGPESSGKTTICQHVIAEARGSMRASGSASGGSRRSRRGPSRSATGSGSRS